MATNSKYWEDEAKIELLKKQWSEGLSASVIAARMGGISRMAVIGKARRLGLAHRKTTIRMNKPKMIVRRAALPLNPRMTDNPVHRLREIDNIRKLKAAPLPAPLPILDEPGGGGGTLLDLEPHHCRYPITRELPHMFCGAGRASGSSYCQRHAAICSSRPLKPINIHPSETVIHTQRGMAA